MVEHPLVSPHITKMVRQSYAVWQCRGIVIAVGAGLTIGQLQERFQTASRRSFFTVAKGFAVIHLPHCVCRLAEWMPSWASPKPPLRGSCSRCLDRQRVKIEGDWLL